MAAELYPLAHYRPVRNTSGSITQPTRGLIAHVQVGTGSLFSWFDNSASQASSHLWLSKSGDFEQYVRFHQRAWAQAAGNRNWISCECEGLPTEDYTVIQVARLAEFYRWGMQQFGWPARVADSPDGFGLGTHRMGGSAWGGHDCPGDIRAKRRAEIILLAAGRPSTATDPRERYAGRPVLRSGSTGPDVAELQNALNIIFGHESSIGDPNRIAVDGLFGPRTQARVATLQRYASPWFGRITDDAICGPATWRKIGYVLTGLHRAV